MGKENWQMEKMWRILKVRENYSGVTEVITASEHFHRASV